MIDTFPEIMLMIVPGMKNGEMRRGPCSESVRAPSSIIGSPPIPDPMFTPMRSAFASVAWMPASAIASIAAAVPKCRNRSKRRASLTGRYLLTSKPFTSPAICEANWAGSKRVMRVMPGRPARTFAQASLTPIPTGLTMPSPVTTTLRLDNSAPSEVTA